MISEHEVDGEILNGTFTFLAKIEAEWKIVDNGIGHYEFWGSVGYHTTQDPELDFYWMNDIFIYDENDILLGLSDMCTKGQDEIHDVITEYLLGVPSELDY